MFPSLFLVAVVTPTVPATAVVALPTELWQVAPDTTGKPWWLVGERGNDRAVILIPGLKLHPLRPNRVTRPELHDWQETKSELVKALARDADVFAFGYAQTVAVDAVARCAGLNDAVVQLKRVGYTEVVLIGHSAGAVIARGYAESFPDAGVTKVIQVAAPNTGSEFAAVFKTGYPKVQAPFVQSLAPGPRLVANRADKTRLGPKVEAVCVVCKVPRIDGDGLVPVASQWPDDLQQQGVPAVLLTASHFDAMKAAPAVRLIADLAREKLTRWTPEQVATARRVLFRDADEPKK